MAWSSLTVHSEWLHVKPSDDSVRFQVFNHRMVGFHLLERVFSMVACWILRCFRLCPCFQSVTSLPAANDRSCDRDRASFERDFEANLLLCAADRQRGRYAFLVMFPPPHPHPHPNPHPHSRPHPHPHHHPRPHHAAIRRAGRHSEGSERPGRTSLPW